LAANTSFNLLNIDLTGLSQNGIQYNVFMWLCKFLLSYKYNSLVF
jgi:hypothetical protein